jgi:hypothetical protein
MDIQYDIPVSTKKSLLKRGLAAGLTAAGTAAVALGLFGYHAETFHHDTSRLLAEIANAKGIQVTFRPRADSPSMPTGGSIDGLLFPKTLADGSLSFDGRITYEHVGLQYNFTVLNDKGFVTVENVTSRQLTRSECLVKDNLPPLSMLTDALKNARVVDAVANPQFNVTCASGKLIEIFFADEPYVFCSTASRQMEVTGEDLSASIQLLQDNSQGDVPTVASLVVPATVNLASCSSLMTSTTAASTRSLTAKTIQRARDAITVAKGERRLSHMGATQCGCTDGLKKCLFVHGLGYNAGETTSSFPDYFGKIETQANCCSEVKFLHIDTVNRTWFDDASTEAICNEAVAMTGSADKMAIENVAIVAHSMGNLVFQAALMNQKCGLAKSSKYIALAGPIYGSASASSAVSIIGSLPKAVQDRLCYDDPNTVIDNLLVKALLSFGLCPTRTAISSIVLKGSKPSTPELDAMFTAAGVQFAKSVSSSLCGVSPIGLLTTDSIQLSILGTVSGHASLENDGQVHIDSCRATIDRSQYSNRWDGGKFYIAGINHLDGTFRNGDGWWGNDRKPIKWFNCQF